MVNGNENHGQRELEPPTDEELTRLESGLPVDSELLELPDLEDMEAAVAAEREARRIRYLASLPRLKRCEAKTRSGKPCQRWAMPNGRCYLHGGASTGPKTPEGRRRAIEAMQAGRKRWLAKRKDKGAAGGWKAPARIL